MGQIAERRKSLGALITLAVVSLVGAGCSVGPESASGDASVQPALPGAGTGTAGGTASPQSASNSAGAQPNTPADAHDGKVAEGTSNAVSGIYGATLYEHRLSADHTVVFYDFGDGMSGIRESLSMDSGDTPFLDGLKPVSSLSEAYQRLNATSAAEVPAAIVAADLRTETVKVGESQRAEEPAGASPLINQAILAGGDGTCSSDPFNDGWGGNWFPSSYCTEGNFRWCQTNLAWADSGYYKTGWSSWRQMEGDFNVNGHITGSKIPCYWYGSCDFTRTIFDYDVFPRHIEIWNLSDSRDYFKVHGTSPCGHLQVAFLKN